MEYRIEKDSIGEKQVPVDAYYGVQSMRGCENFHITGQRMQPEFINSMAEIKKACAICNCQVGELDVKIKDAICQACDEIIAGKLHDQFLCDPIQGGAGTTAVSYTHLDVYKRQHPIRMIPTEYTDFSLVGWKFALLFVSIH